MARRVHRADHASTPNPTIDDHEGVHVIPRNVVDVIV